MGENSTYLDKERVKELWTFLKTELAKKAAVGDLADLVDTDELATALGMALVPYAKTSDVATALSGALSRQIVDSLPSVSDADPTVIYFVPSPSAKEDNIKDEYMLINGKFELIGSTRIDLSGYWSKEELRAMTSAELSEILV